MFECLIYPPLASVNFTLASYCNYLTYSAFMSVYTTIFLCKSQNITLFDYGKPISKDSFVQNPGNLVNNLLYVDPIERKLFASTMKLCCG
jgi:hypothetical protein